MKNRAFCDTCMNICTQLLYPMTIHIKTGPQPNFGRVGHFSKWPTSEFSMSHISANNEDRNFVSVSKYTFQCHGIQI
jgi:hypothetical protein